MQIAFRKVARDGQEFTFTSKDLRFYGKVSLKKSNLVSCTGKIEGKTLCSCDICAKDIELEIDESVDLLLVDGVYKEEEDELDVIEFFDGQIEFEEILASEVGAIVSDYHYCEDCTKKLEGE